MTRRNEGAMRKDLQFYSLLSEQDLIGVGKENKPQSQK